MMRPPQPQLELELAKIRSWHDGARWAYREMATIKGGEMIPRVGPHDRPLDEVLKWVDLREHDCLTDAQSAAQREREVSARS